MESVSGTIVSLFSFELDWLDCYVSAQRLWVKRLSQVFKLRVVKECCLWQVILNLTPFTFYLKNISFCHQTEDLESHRLD